MNKRRGDYSLNQRLGYMTGISIVIGIICTFVAFALLKLISFFTNLFFFQSFSLQSNSPATNSLGWMVVLIPALGGLIIGLMARFGSEKIRGHGIPEALEAILFGKSIMLPKVALLKPLSSAISIGSGGPFGAEGPIIMTGGAVGSLIAQTFNLTDSERKTLLVAGAAAGMSAVFASPIAAVLLAVELLLFEWRPRSLIPVAFASAAAAAVRPFLLEGSAPIFPLLNHVEITFVGILTACLVGIIAGAFSIGTSTLLYKLEDAFHRLPFHWMWWCMIGGFVVGVGGYFQPRALGVGYDVIQDLLVGNVLAQAAISLLVVKSLIWVVSLASGTSGGVLAPLLMMGCGLGVLESMYFPQELKVLYPLISMAAVMGGMMRAPFTALIFALELTHNIDALLPTLVATIAAYAITVRFMKRSILTEKVARRGFDIFREYGIDPLETTSVEESMTKTLLTIPAKMPIAEVVNSFFSGKKKFRGYPVVASDGELIGMLTASDILNQQLTEENKELVAEEMVAGAAFTILTTDSLREAAEKMAYLGIGRLAVVDVNNSRQLVGILTRSDLLKPRLKHQQAEKNRERVREISREISKVLGIKT
jgi:H+/Cl- antiporter ClcA/predicted transcriptional regulator